MGRERVVAGMLLCLMALSPVPPCAAQPATGASELGEDGLTPATREWQANAIVRLKEFRPSATTLVFGVKEHGDDTIEVYRGGEGLLWLGREDWVYLTSFWSHTADPQVVLVISRGGRIYRDFEHICPVLFLHSPTGTDLNSLQAFLATTTAEGGDPRPWELLDESAVGPDRDGLMTAWEHQKQVALAANARPEARRLAVLALAREGGDESWEIVEEVLAESTDWALIDAVRRAVGDEGRADVIDRILDDALGADPEERGRRLAGAIIAAETRQSVDHYVFLADDASAAALYAALERPALAEDEDSHRQLGAFQGLRNSVTAYAALAPERAEALYRSLLDSPNAYRRRAGIYGVGELRVNDVTARLLASVDPDQENAMFPWAICVALGKVGTPEAQDGLIELLTPEPPNADQSRAVLLVMTEICGGQSGISGNWENGYWVTVADDRQELAQRFATAMRDLAERTPDEKLAREATSRASYIVSVAR